MHATLLSLEPTWYQAVAMIACGMDYTDNQQHVDISTSAASADGEIVEQKATSLTNALLVQNYLNASTTPAHTTKLVMHEVKSEGKIKSRKSRILDMQANHHTCNTAQVDQQWPIIGRVSHHHHQQRRQPSQKCHCCRTQHSTEA
jgi:uncharacterized protein YdaT